MGYEAIWQINKHPWSGQWWVTRHLWRDGEREVKWFVASFPTATEACAYLETM